MISVLLMTIKNAHGEGMLVALSIAHLAIFGFPRGEGTRLIGWLILLLLASASVVGAQGIYIFGTSSVSYYLIGFSAATWFLLVPYYLRLQGNLQLISVDQTFRWFAYSVIFVSSLLFIIGVSIILWHWLYGLIICVVGIVIRAVIHIVAAVNEERGAKWLPPRIKS
jgi:hypothetical protein